MSDFDLFTGQPIHRTADEPRYWCDHPARDWHIEAARKADTTARLAHEIATEQDPLKRHSLQVRLATLTGGAIPVYQEPAKPTRNHEDETKAVEFVRRTRKKQGIR